MAVTAGYSATRNFFLVLKTYFSSGVYLENKMVVSNKDGLRYVNREFK